MRTLKRNETQTNKPQQQKQQPENDRTDKAMAVKHSTASYRPVPSIYRIVLLTSSNQCRAKYFTTVILVGACYFIININSLCRERIHNSSTIVITSQQAFYLHVMYLN